MLRKHAGSEVITRLGNRRLLQFQRGNDPYMDQYFKYLLSQRAYDIIHNRPLILVTHRLPEIVER